MRTTSPRLTFAFSGVFWLLPFVHAQGPAPRPAASTEAVAACEQSAQQSLASKGAPPADLRFNGPPSAQTDRSNDGQFSAMPVKVAGGVLPLTMLVNGISVGEIDSRRQRLVDPPGPGFARLTVIDATGAADTVVIRVQ